MKLSKFFVITLNICLLVLSITIISTASSPRFILGDFYNILIKGNNIGSLNLIWIGSGFVLMAMGIFGLWSALKESTFMMNLYTLTLSFALILQIVTATTSNTLSSELDYLVSHSIKDLMSQYGNDLELTGIMDSIQIEYECCGYNNPYDWHSLDKFSTTKPIIKTFTEITTWDETASSLLTSQASLEDNTITPETIRTENTLPTSCCKNKCKSYYTRGCFKILYNDIARVVFMVKSVSMITSVLQIFAILAAYIFGRTLRDLEDSREPFPDHIRRF